MPVESSVAANAVRLSTFSGNGFHVFQYLCYFSPFCVLSCQSCRRIELLHRGLFDYLNFWSHALSFAITPTILRGTFVSFVVISLDLRLLSLLPSLDPVCFLPT